MLIVVIAWITSKSTVRICEHRNTSTPDKTDARQNRFVSDVVTYILNALSTGSTRESKEYLLRTQENSRELQRLETFVELQEERLDGDWLRGH